MFIKQIKHETLTTPTSLDCIFLQGSGESRNCVYIYKSYIDIPGFVSYALA